MLCRKSNEKGNLEFSLSHAFRWWMAKHLLCTHAHSSESLFVSICAIPFRKRHSSNWRLPWLAVRMRLELTVKLAKRLPTWVPNQIPRPWHMSPAEMSKPPRMKQCWRLSQTSFRVCRRRTTSSKKICSWKSLVTTSTASWNWTEHARVDRGLHWSKEHVIGGSLDGYCCRAPVPASPHATSRLAAWEAFDKQVKEAWKIPWSMQPMQLWSSFRRLTWHAEWT